MLVKTYRIINNLTTNNFTDIWIVFSIVSIKNCRCLLENSKFVCLLNHLTSVFSKLERGLQERDEFFKISRASLLYTYFLSKNDYVYTMRHVAWIWKVLLIHSTNHRSFAGNWFEMDCIKNNGEIVKRTKTTTHSLSWAQSVKAVNKSYVRKISCLHLSYLYHTRNHRKT